MLRLLFVVAGQGFQLPVVLLDFLEVVVPVLQELDHLVEDVCGVRGV